MFSKRNHLAPVRVSAVALLMALSLSACGDDDTTKPEDTQSPPVTPPLSSMRVDLTFFGDGAAAAPGTEALLGTTTDLGDDQALTLFNWTNAVIRVLIVNVFVDAAFTPPFTVFALALHSFPTLQEDGSFLWTYLHSEGGQEIRIDLNGRPSGHDVIWELRVTDPTHEPPLDNARWFHGVARGDGRQGYWLFEDPTRGGVEYARIDWEVASEDDAELTITNLDEGDDGVGDVITYRMDSPIASLSYEDVSEDASMVVQWDTSSGEGSLLAPDYNGGERACWDEDRQDVACDAVPSAL